MAQRKLVVEIVGDHSSLSRAFRTSGTEAGKFGRSMSAVGRGLLSVGKTAAFVAGGAAIGGLAVVLHAGIKEWQESTKVTALTEAALKSTGGAANVTAKDVDTLAQSLLAKTGIDDEVIQSGENMLLTFTAVRNELGKGNDIFNQATTAALDLSTRGFGSVTATSKILGKALSDPVKGMSALRRVGVVFTADQQKLIASLVKTGDVLEAQKIILKGVEERVGGSAQAFGDTLPGQIAKAREEFNNLSGNLVGTLAPAFGVVLGGVNDMLTKFNQADGASAKLRVVWDSLASGAKAAGTAFIDAFHKIDWNQLLTTIKDGLQRVGQRLDEVDWGAAARRISTAIATAIDKAPITEVTKAIVHVLARAADNSATFIRNIDWNKLGKATVDGIARGIAAADWKEIFNGLVKLMMATNLAALNFILGIAGALGRGFVNGIVAGVTAVGDFAARIAGWVKSKVVGAFSGAATWLYQAGLDIFQGLWDGMKNKAQGLITWAEKKARDIRDALKHPWGVWGSPPSVAIQMGEDIMLGIGIGITKGVPVTVGLMNKASRALVAQVAGIQAQLDQISRASEDAANQKALRDAKNATDREAALEAIRVTALNRELTQRQAAADRLIAQAQKTSDSLRASQDAAQTANEQSLQRSLDRMQKALQAAQSKAAAAWSNLGSLIQQAFSGEAGGFVGKSQAQINAITARRETEDLAQAVTDARDQLAQAAEGGDAAAILTANRNLARAQEDIQLQNLAQMAANEDTAHQQQIDARQRDLTASLTALETSFTQTGVKTKTGMDAVLKIINDYLGGFKTAGATLGGAFSTALQEAVQDAVAAANRIVAEKAHPLIPKSVSGAFTFGGSFASGGTVPGPMGAPRMILAHGGETVTPAGRGGVVVNNYFPNYTGDKRELEAMLRNASQKYFQRNARSAYA